jgi:hypothetical protein
MGVVARLERGPLITTPSPKQRSHFRLVIDFAFIPPYSCRVFKNESESIIFFDVATDGWVDGSRELRNPERAK